MGSSERAGGIDQGGGRRGARLGRAAADVHVVNVAPLDCADWVVTRNQNRSTSWRGSEGPGIVLDLREHDVAVAPHHVGDIQRKTLT
jgi:hypothetical protein